MIFQLDFGTVLSDSSISCFNFFILIISTILFRIKLVKF